MTAAHPLATLARIWFYPVKSLAPTELTRAHIGPDGLDGDRRGALFVTSENHGRSGKTFRGKEHNLLHTLDAPADAVALAAARGVAVRERDGGPHFDAQPVSLLFDRWLEELEAIVGMALDPQRFRPNLWARSDGHAVPREREMVGALLEVGGVLLRVVSPITRCVTPTYDVATGEPAPEISRAIVRERENLMGVYCTVERSGELSTGDEIAVASET
jgi:uncharacterized protein YcbX